MPWDYAYRRRAERRYRLIFRVSALLFCVGILSTTVGVLVGFVSADWVMFGGGMLLMSMSGLNAYRAVTSTVKILELDASDGDVIWLR